MINLFKNNNFIHHSRGLLTSEQCENLIYYYKMMKFFHTEGALGADNSRRVDRKEKACTEIYVDTNVFSDIKSGSYMIFLPIIKALNAACTEYQKKYSFLSGEGVASWTLFNNFKIQYYKPTEAYYRTHCENDGYGQSIQYLGRMLAWMVYLNDVNDGGETSFPTQNVKFKPRCGDVLIWPAFWTHPHNGIPSPTQEKYIATGWYNYIPISNKEISEVDTSSTIES